MDRMEIFLWRELWLLLFSFIGRARSRIEEATQGKTGPWTATVKSSCYSCNLSVGFGWLLVETGKKKHTAEVSYLFDRYRVMHSRLPHELRKGKLFQLKYNNSIEYRAASRVCRIKKLLFLDVKFQMKLLASFFMNPDEGSNVETANLVILIIPSHWVVIEKYQNISGAKKYFHSVI